MRYLSPFDLAQIAPVPTLDRETLRKARAYVLNQFELEGTTTVYFGDQELDKHTALALLEQLTDPKTSGFHYRIAQDSSLSQFLKGQMPTTPPQQLLGENDPFTEFVMPYWVDACAEHLLKGLKTSREFNVGNAMMMIGEMVGQKREKALQPALNWLRLGISRMDALGNGTLQTAEIEEAKGYLDLSEALVVFLNALPLHYAHLRESFASHYVSLGIVETRRQRYSYNNVKFMVESLIRRLKVSDEQAILLRQRLEQAFALFSIFEKSEELLGRMKTLQGNVEPRKANRSGGWIFLIPLVILLSVFVLTSRKGGHHSTNIFNYRQPSIDLAPFLKMQSDSLFSTKQMEESRRRLDSIMQTLNLPTKDTSTPLKQHLKTLDSTDLSEAEKRNQLWEKALELGRDRNEGDGQ